MNRCSTSFTYSLNLFPSSVTCTFALRYTYTCGEGLNTKIPLEKQQQQNVTSLWLCVEEEHVQPMIVHHCLSIQVTSGHL